jgi:hypothetical protein
LGQMPLNKQVHKAPNYSDVIEWTGTHEWIMTCTCVCHDRYFWI